MNANARESPDPLTANQSLCFLQFEANAAIGESDPGLRELNRWGRGESLSGNVQRPSYEQVQSSLDFRIHGRRVRFVFKRGGGEVRNVLTLRIPPSSAVQLCLLRRPQWA